MIQGWNLRDLQNLRGADLRDACGGPAVGRKVRGRDPVGRACAMQTVRGVGDLAAMQIRVAWSERDGGVKKITPRNAGRRTTRAEGDDPAREF